MARKKRSTVSRQAEQKPQINVRMDTDLYECVKEDAVEGERKNPAQVRLILRQHYAKRLKAMKRKKRK